MLRNEQAKFGIGYCHSSDECASNYCQHCDPFRLLSFQILTNVPAILVNMEAHAMIERTGTNAIVSQATNLLTVQCVSHA